MLVGEKEGTCAANARTNPPTAQRTRVVPLPFAPDTLSILCFLLFSPHGLRTPQWTHPMLFASAREDELAEPDLEPPPASHLSPGAQPRRGPRRMCSTSAFFWLSLSLRSPRPQTDAFTHAEPFSLVDSLLDSLPPTSHTRPVAFPPSRPASAPPVMSAPHESSAYTLPQPDRPNRLPRNGVPSCPAPHDNRRRALHRRRAPAPAASSLSAFLV
jgi:hypothetical protein